MSAAQVRRPIDARAIGAWRRCVWLCVCLRELALCVSNATLAVVIFSLSLSLSHTHTHQHSYQEFLEPMVAPLAVQHDLTSLIGFDYLADVPLSAGLDSLRRPAPSPKVKADHAYLDTSCTCTYTPPHMIKMH